MPKPPRSLSKLGSFENFKTFDEEGLVRMRNIAAQFATDVQEAVNPYWLTLCGTSGGGKTLLCDHVYSIINELPHLAHHPRLVHGVRRIHWPIYADRIFDQRWVIQELADLNFLFIDEMSIERDKAGFEREALCRILLNRTGKWTMLTSNHSVKDIGDKIDVRLASRAARDGSVVVEINTTDFALR